VGIAVLDSGMDAGHKTLSGRVVYSKDFTGENRTDDPFGHGSHVASAAAGVATSSAGTGSSYTGIAQGAPVINLRVLNAQGTGSTAGVLNALNWVMANKGTYKIRVVNMSLGGAAVDSYKNDPICRAVRQLVDAGVVVVVAAGNNGKNSAGQKIYGSIHSPGNEPSALTVGAANTFGTDGRNDDGVTTFSSRGPTRSFWTDATGVRHYDNLIKPDVVAPGNRLIYAESDRNLLVTQHPELDASAKNADDKRFM
jgi:subtilisin family serine protease